MKKERGLLALDTEDDSRGHVGIINFFDGRAHVTFQGPRLRERAWAWLVARAPATVWACQMEYDLLNLFGSEWVGKLCTLQYVRSGLLRATLCEAKVLFLDTLRHWPATVAEMGAEIGLPKLQKNFTSVEYCRRDTEIVWRFVRAMLDRYDRLGLTLKNTLPSMALQLWRRFYPREMPELPAHVQAFAREAYYGGRVEVYRQGWVPSGTRHYDVNSLFPSVMARERFPDCRGWRGVRSPDWRLEGVAEVTVTIPSGGRFPPLPVRADEEIVFPTGRVRGAWVYPELRRAMRDGAVIEEVHAAVECPRTERPFGGYVRYCYGRRRRAASRIDDRFWKLFLNSTYGKFGQQEGLEVIVNDRSMTLRTNPPKHLCVMWAAYVTAYARLRLLALLRGCRTVYYTDTDSLFTPDVLPVSTRLGALKLVGVTRRSRGTGFFGNKTYIWNGRAKAKGVPACGVPEHARGCSCTAMAFIEAGRAIFRRPARLRESRRTFAEANVWYEVEKRRDASYTKRRVLPSGETVAWDYAEYLHFMKGGGP